MIWNLETVIITFFYSFNGTIFFLYDVLDTRHSNRLFAAYFIYRLLNTENIYHVYLQFFAKVARKLRKKDRARFPTLLLSNSSLAFPPRKKGLFPLCEIRCAHSLPSRSRALPRMRIFFTSVDSPLCSSQSHSPWHEIGREVKHISYCAHRC